MANRCWMVKKNPKPNEQHTTTNQPKNHHPKTKQNLGVREIRLQRQFLLSCTRLFRVTTQVSKAGGPDLAIIIICGYSKQVQ